MKTLAEKAITTENYDIFLLLLDMSNTFVTVHHTKRMNMMHDELHLMHVLINDEILNVKIVNKTGPDIHIEICQDDLSAVMSILYLAFSVKPLPPFISAIDSYKPLW